MVVVLKLKVKRHFDTARLKRKTIMTPRTHATTLMYKIHSVGTATKISIKDTAQN